MTMNISFTKFYQLLAAFTAAIGFVSDGMHIGWTSPIIPVLKLPNTPVAIEESDIVWLENLYLIGSVASLPLTIFFAGKVGRKMVILFAASLHLISWGLIGTATSVELLLMARFVAGAATHTSYIGQKMYLPEIADKDVRGTLSVLILCMAGIGSLLMFSIGPFLPLYISASIGASFVLFQVSTFVFMPESPYYLLSINKTKDARKSLEYLRAHVDVAKELEEISSAVERQKSESGRFIDLLIVPSNRRALFIACTLNAAAILSSFTAIQMNIQSIFELTDTLIPPTTVAIAFSAIGLLMALLSASTVDRFSRKIVLSTGCFIAAFAIATLATYFTIKNTGIDVFNYGWIPDLSIIIFTMAFHYGFISVVIIIEGEIFSTNVKTIGLSTSGFIFNIFGIICINIYQYLVKYGGMHVAFYVFSCCCFLTGIFTIFFVPETKGKTLEEIQFALKGKKYEPDSRKQSEIKTTGF